MKYIKNNSDWKESSQQGHEVKYILKKFEKKESKENVQMLKQIIIDFKDEVGGQNVKDYTKQELYKYIVNHDNFDLLEDKE